MTDSPERETSTPEQEPETWTEYYDTEAGDYDDSRGGRLRAEAAADAIAHLVAPPADRPGVLLDVAGGTGIVSAELAGRGWSVAVLDASAGMLRVARTRLPGRVLRTSADRLPVRDRGVDLVTVIWMLNLVPVELADAILAEAARVLAPGGSLVLTVNKEQSHDRDNPTRTDDQDRVGTLLAPRGFVLSGTATFSGRSPWGSVTDDDPQFRLAAYRWAG